MFGYPLRGRDCLDGHFEVQGHSEVPVGSQHSAESPIEFGIVYSVRCRLLSATVRHVEWKLSYGCNNSLAGWQPSRRLDPQRGDMEAPSRF